MDAAKQHAESEFGRCRIVQDRLFESDFDKSIKALLEEKVTSILPRATLNAPLPWPNDPKRKIAIYSMLK